MTIKSVCFALAVSLAATAAMAGGFQWLSATRSATVTLGSGTDSEPIADRDARNALNSECAHLFARSRLSRVDRTADSCQRTGNTGWTCTVSYEGLCEAD